MSTFNWYSYWGVYNYHTKIASLKYFMTEQALKITSEALQIHGASSCIDNTTVDRLDRDCKLLKIGGGTNEIMLEMIARNISREDRMLI